MCYALGWCGLIGPRIRYLEDTVAAWLALPVGNNTPTRSLGRLCLFLWFVSITEPGLLLVLRESTMTCSCRDLPWMGEKPHWDRVWLTIRRWPLWVRACGWRRTGGKEERGGVQQRQNYGRENERDKLSASPWWPRPFLLGQTFANAGSCPFRGFPEINTALNQEGATVALRLFCLPILRDLN